MVKPKVIVQLAGCKCLRVLPTRMNTIGHFWVSAGYGLCKVRTLYLTFLDDGQTPYFVSRILSVKSRKSVQNQLDMYMYQPRMEKHPRQKKRTRIMFGSCWYPSQSWWQVISQMLAPCSRAAGSISNVFADIAGVYWSYVQNVCGYQKRTPSICPCGAVLHWLNENLRLSPLVSQAKRPSYRGKIPATFEHQRIYLWISNDLIVIQLRSHHSPSYHPIFLLIKPYTNHIQSL